MKKRKRKERVELRKWRLARGLPVKSLRETMMKTENEKRNRKRRKQERLREMKENGGQLVNKRNVKRVVGVKEEGLEMQTATVLNWRKAHEKYDQNKDRPITNTGFGVNPSDLRYRREDFKGERFLQSWSDVPAPKRARYEQGAPPAEAESTQASR